MDKIEQNKYNVDIMTEFEAQENGEQVYILEKIVDVFKNIGELHPNGINLGYIKIGTFKEPPTVGENFEIFGNKIGNYLITSIVTEIIDEETFKTEHSTYKLTKYENNKKRSI